jgi:SET domain-containing protein
MPKKTTTYSPLPDCLILKKSKLHGMGMIAARQIAAGYDLGVTHVADDRFLHGQIRTPLGGFINHSSQPNCALTKDPEDDELTRLTTLREIEEDEELTLDYMANSPRYDEKALTGFK